MNTFLIILFIIVIVLIFLGLSYIHLYNKLNESIIRINEAELRIDNNLREKYDILNKSVSLIKNITKLDDKAFTDLAKLKARKISNFELDRILVDVYTEFLTIYEKNKDLRDNDDITINWNKENKK